ncbi:hypothetical protein F5Y15DRAFT_220093 [Xylariaceae sp. FL0016]|nr:hypothetical protein F5Y15DRAFT_220093 [Xylariaceae sp. FL0016]
MAYGNPHHPLPAPPPPAQQGYKHPSSSYQPQNQPQPHHQPSQQPPPPAPAHHSQSQLQSRQFQQQQAPQVQKQERTRPKSRAFSFRSDKSQKSANSHPHQKLDLFETSAEKEAKRLHSKADPRMALNELEPSMEAQSANADVMSLRSIQHKDTSGNPIADPDRSNPTRSRWERPLDTIRSFEAAIDGGYNRKSIYRSDTESLADWNRRSSYYGSEYKCIFLSYPARISHPRFADNGPRFPQDSYYGGRPESGFFDPRQSMMRGPRDSYHDGFDGGPYGNSGVGSRNRFSRNQSEPHLNGRPLPGRNPYPVPNNHRSYETVASGSGSASYGEPAGYQTDPTSSENSSIDRRSPPKRQEPVNDYGISFGQSPTYKPPTFGVASSSGGPPAVPAKDVGAMLRKPSKPAIVKRESQQRPDPGEKRKSWFMRRFSKNS